jgi:hypothetical protein
VLIEQPTLRGGAFVTHYTATVRLDQLLTDFLDALQRAIDMVAFGTNAALAATDSSPDTKPAWEADGQISPLPIPLLGALVQLIASPREMLGFEDARTEFQRWVLACGFRDAIEALGPLLEQSRVIGVCARWGKGPVNGAIWNDDVVGGERKFDRMHLQDKIRHLRGLCGRDIFPASLSMVESINAARNCIVHRDGIVGKSDLKNVNDSTSKGLRVEWSAFDLVFTRLDGTATVINELPAHIEADGTLGFRQSNVSKLFELGSVITFSPREFVDICLTMIVFGEHLAANLRQLLVDRGLLDSAAKS